MGEVTSDDVADCIQREWAAARALDAERDATTGRGVDVRARGAVGRLAATDGGGGGGRADVERRPTKKKKRKKGQGSKAKRDKRRVDDGYD